MLLQTIFLEIERTIIVFVFLIFPLIANAQDCCEDDFVTTICYTGQTEYCPDGITCNYTLGGEFMMGLYKKLSNPANFGSTGILDCDLELTLLPDINSVADIEILKCDIVIIGNYAVNNFGAHGTHLGATFLNHIRDWSLKCANNISILSQGEAEAWGYGIVEQNQNPNTQGASVNVNIFDGVFGTLSEFNQGGGFQAHFNIVPPSGNTILAQDLNGNSTIVLDKLTNDIILADVGIICNEVGEVTNSSSILNENDILACNIIELACKISRVGNCIPEEVIICEGDQYILANGQSVDTEGIYTVVIQGAGGCDSTVITSLNISKPEESFFEYFGCKNDDFAIQVGTSTFDESNPTEQTTLQNEYSCDSTVIVNLLFNSNTFATFDTLICSDDLIDLHGNLIDSDTDTTIIINNIQGCDSIINVKVSDLLLSQVDIPDSVTISNNQKFQFENLIPPNYEIAWSPVSGLSCDDCANPFLINGDNIPFYTISLQSPEGCELDFEIGVHYVCTPYIPNTFSPRSIISENSSFKPLAPCQLQDYSLEIYNKWGALVFESTDQDESWNGLYRQKFVSAGIYIYVLKYSNIGELFQTSGTLTVLY